MSPIVRDKTQFDSRPRRARHSATREPAPPPGTPRDLPRDALAYPAVSAFAPAMDFRVDLEMFRGPLDLLLYLVRRHELDVSDIPVALITDQFVAHLEVLEHLDVDAVGDFIEVASLLIEIKSRTVLPQVEDEEAILVEHDARDELVQRLLEYKKYKDAASMLDESGHQWQQRFCRVANDLPPREIDPAQQPIHEVELWDLVSAMGRIMRESQLSQPSNIVYDDTPIHVYMQQIHDLLRQRGRISFCSLFCPGMHKGMLIGVFLAVLELVRNHGVVVEQKELHSDMWLMPSDEFRATLEFREADASDADASDAEETVGLPAKPR